MKRSGMLRRSLSARLALALGLISLLVVVTMGLAIYGLTATYLGQRTEDDLAALASFYAAYTASTAPDEARLVALAPQIVGFFAPQSGYEVRLFNGRNGLLLGSSRDIGPLPSRAALDQIGSRRSSLFLAASQDLPDRLYSARSLTTSQGDLLAVVEVSRDVRQASAFLGILRWVLAGAGAVALAAALLASLLLARQLVRPLQEMEAATQAIAAGDFERRVSVSTADEVGRLAASVNRMAQDLARLEAARREFIARISHDLRTPLTAIKGLVVNLQDAASTETLDVLNTLDEQTDRLIRLVNDLLTLSRLQRGEAALRRTSVDLGAVAGSAFSLLQARARRNAVTLHLAVPEDLPPITGDADRLEQAAVNLLDNAVRYTPPGGEVRVELTREQGQIAFSVRDTGRGLTPEEEARAFEPYFRGPEGGTGLGLSIAREIVLAHGGRIWLANRPGGGAEAGFALPEAGF